MINQRWLLILDDQPGPVEPRQRYRLWLVKLDEENPSVPLCCDTLDELYQALFTWQENAYQSNQAGTAETTCDTTTAPPE